MFTAIWRFVSMEAFRQKQTRNCLVVSDTGNGRARGDLELNPCRDIKYNPTKPSAKIVESKDLAYAMAEARIRGGSYLIMALCFYVAYLTTSRPEEMRSLTRQSIKEDGIEIEVGKRRATQHKKPS